MRGMVAGQPIVTQAQTKEFDEGYERIFGKDRKPTRGRWVWDEDLKEMVEVGADWTDAERRAQTPTEELIYSDTKATDGTPINTRKRHREYLKRNGLCMASDYSQEYREKEKRNRELKDDKDRRETVERAFYKSRGY